MCHEMDFLIGLALVASLSRGRKVTVRRCSRDTISPIVSTGIGITFLKLEIEEIVLLTL